jgi:hypothetical protein
LPGGAAGNLFLTGARLRLGQPAVGEQIGRLVGCDVEFGKPAPRAELRAGADALGQFEVVADIEELDRVIMVFGKSEKRMGPRGDDPAAQFEGLRKAEGWPLEPLLTPEQRATGKTPSEITEDVRERLLKVLAGALHGARARFPLGIFFSLVRALWRQQGLASA